MPNDDEEAATPAQKLAIANFFVMSSPPGQVDEVLADVAKLVGNGKILTNAVITKMLREYNKAQYMQVEHNGEKMLVTPFAKVQDDEYVEPNSGEIMTIDHRARTAKSSGQKQKLKQESKAVRDAIAKEMATYMDNMYKPGKATAAVYTTDNGKITVCISALNKKLSNFWSGGWRSTFTVNANSAGSAEIQGNAKIHIHYFEDGNVQLNAEKKKSSQVTITKDATATAKAIVEAISKWESEYQSSVEEMYVEMHTKTFKSMRRFLPKTRKPMDWNPHFHSLASEIAKH